MAILGIAMLTSATYNDDNDSPTQSQWTDEELAKANTAARCSGLAKVDKDIIFYCNLARLDGAKFWRTYGKSYAKGSASYVNSLERDLMKVKDRPMLVPEASLTRAAEAHASDMLVNDFFDHTSFDGTSFGQRVRSYYKGGFIAENLAAGYNHALSIVMQLLVDDNVPSVGHRKNILNEQYNAVGVNTTVHKTWRNITVMDFGDTVYDNVE